MSLPFSLQYTFSNVSGSIPLSYLDADLSGLAIAINAVGNGTSQLNQVLITTANIATAFISNLSLQNPVSIASGGLGANLTPFTDGQVLIGSNTTGGIVKTTLTAGANITIVNSPAGISISGPSANIFPQLRQVVFTSSGIFTPNVSTTHKITVVGAGGCGGEAGQADRVGGGGGAGATAISWNFLTAGTNITVAVGSVAANTSGGNSVVMLTGSNITALGGAIGDSKLISGPGNIVVNGGIGGMALNGVININGGSGYIGMPANVTANIAAIGGAGGNSLFGYGGAKTVKVGNGGVVGNPGTGFGSGGSGSASIPTTGIYRAGGLGAAGIVIFEWSA